jgi:hypothetical protein
MEDNSHTHTCGHHFGGVLAAREIKRTAQKEYSDSACRTRDQYKKMPAGGGGGDSDKENHTSVKPHEAEKRHRPASSRGCNCGGDTECVTAKQNEYGSLAIDFFCNRGGGGA